MIFIAQGNALGILLTISYALKGQKYKYIAITFALTGRIILAQI